MVLAECFYVIFRWCPQKRKVGVVPYMFRMSRECAIQPCDYRKKDKRFSYFAVDSFSIYVIRSQHKQYWGYASSGMSLCQSVSGSQNVRAHSSLTQHHLLDSSAIPLSQPQISCDSIACTSIPGSMKQVLTSTSALLWGMTMLITKCVYQILYQVPYILS